MGASSDTNDQQFQNITSYKSYISMKYEDLTREKALLKNKPHVNKFFETIMCSTFGEIEGLKLINYICRPLPLNTSFEKEMYHGMFHHLMSCEHKFNLSPPHFDLTAKNELIMHVGNFLMLDCGDELKAVNCLKINNCGIEMKVNDLKSNNLKLWIMLIFKDNSYSSKCTCKPTGCRNIDHTCKGILDHFNNPNKVNIYTSIFEDITFHFKCKNSFSGSNNFIVSDMSLIVMMQHYKDISITLL